MTYGWEDDVDREMAMDGHGERIDEDDGCDTDLPAYLLWCEPDPDDEGQLDHFTSFDEMAEHAMRLQGGLA